MLTYTEQLAEGGHSFNCATQAVTVILLSSAVAPNKGYRVVKTDTNAFAITVNAAGGDTFVGGATSITIPASAQGFTYIRRGGPGQPIQIVAGAGSLTGLISGTSPITVAGWAISLGLAGITNAFLAANAVQAANIAAGQVTATAMAANAITATNGALAANSVVDSNVSGVGVTKLISGTNIFTGPVYLSQGNTNPVVALLNTGIFFYSEANTSGSNPSGSVTSVLTNLPYVAVQNTGVGVFGLLSGGLQASVITNGSGITLWTNNGSTASAYMALSAAGGISMINGPFAAFLTASEFEIVYDNGVSGAGHVQFTNALSAAQIQLAYWTGSPLAIVSSLTLQSGSVTLANGAGSLTLTPNLMTLVAGSGGSQITLDNIGNATFTKPGGGSTVILGNGINCSSLTAVTVEVTNTLEWGPGLSSATATAGAATLPANPVGFVPITIAGAGTFKQPYFNN